MTKYTEQFKLEVVQEYLSSGSAGLRAVAQRYGIPSHFMVRKWVLAYQVHGNVGQNGKRSQYSAEFKLSVLQYMWGNQLSNQLRMELAYLKKLEALVQARPKQAPKKKRK